MLMMRVPVQFISTWITDSMEQLLSFIPLLGSFKDLLCLPTMMQSSRRRTGRVYRICSRVLRLKIPSKLGSLALDLTQSIISQVQYTLQVTLSMDNRAKERDWKRTA